MRVVIGAIALFCGMALLGEPRGPATRAQAQATDLCGWLGVAVSPMTSAFAASLGMVQPYGAIFEQPEPGSPAAHAGIRAGDVITSVNGTNIDKASDFAKMIAGMAPETIVYLATYRDSQPMELQITLGSGKCPPAQDGSLSVLAFQS
jgi:membrane-associated protease RseP (regulator of RpoE activity)